jgi:hypothetical protein
MNRRLPLALLAAAITLAVAQALLEDVSVLAAWPAAPRQAVRLAGFFLDLYFTSEFLARLGLALSERRAESYLGPERGWLDFLASAPLLVLASGPWAVDLLFGTALCTTGLLAAARVARALRLLRPARLGFGLLERAPGMAAGHASLLALLGSAVLALGLTAAVLTGSLRPGLQRELDRRQELTAAGLAQASSPATAATALQSLVRADPSLLVAREGQATLYSRQADDLYAREFALGDYRYLRAGDLELFFDIRPAVSEAAAQDLLFQLLVLLLLAGLFGFYAPHFTRVVTDPLEVMRRGLAEDGFNLQVRVPEDRREEEVFRLAREYNERWLPLKDRDRRGEPPSLLTPEDARPAEPESKEGGA